jgi:hypothetical protein
MAEATQYLFSPIEVAEALVIKMGIHEGFYELGFEFQVTIGALGQEGASVLPGAMFGISKIGLTKTQVLTPLSVDAAIVNPKK